MTQKITNANNMSVQKNKSCFHITNRIFFFYLEKKKKSSLTVKTVIIVFNKTICPYFYLQPIDLLFKNKIFYPFNQLKPIKKVEIIFII